MNEESLPHRSMLEAVVHDPVRGSYSAAAVQGGGPRSPRPPETCHHHIAIKQGCFRGRASVRLLSSRGPRSGRRVVDLGKLEAHEEHGAIVQQRGCAATFRAGEFTTLAMRVRDGGPGPRVRIVQLGRVHIAVPAVGPADHEHLAVEQQRGCVAVTRCDHPPGRGPGPAVRVVHLCAELACHQDLAVAQHRGRAATTRPTTRVSTILAVAVQVPLSGSYTSAPMVSAAGSSISPTSTLPSSSSVGGKPPPSTHAAQRA